MSPSLVGKRNIPVLAGDGASLMGDLHSPQLEDSITASPRLGRRQKFSEYGLDDLMHAETIDKARGWTQKITELFNTIGKSSSQIFSQLGDITNVGINKTASSPLLVTGGAAVIGLGAGLKAIKNILHGVKVGMNPKIDPKLGWLPHEGLGILQGGLSFGLLATFLGKKNLFTEIEDGKPVVKVKSLVAALLACVGVSSAMGLAQGVSVLRKIPFIGAALQEIFETLFGAAKEVTVPIEENANPHGAPPGMH